MVFNTTFNNISVISWQSVLLVEETLVPGENHRPAASVSTFKGLSDRQCPPSNIATVTKNRNFYYCPHTICFYLKVKIEF